MAISSIGIVTNQSPAAYQLAIESIGYLAEKVSEIFVEANLLLDIERRNSDIGQGLRVLDYSRRLDLLLVFGGDGTILRSIRSIGDLQIPVCGINLGRTGFLSQVEPKDLKKALQRLLLGDFEVSRRMKIEIFRGGEKVGSGLNEVLIHGENPGKLFRANIQIGSKVSMILEGDGILVSTPTGSTGHCVSAGGPVVDTSLELMLVVPVCPIRPIRPIVLPPEEEVTVSSTMRSRIAVDGEQVGDAEPGVEISVKRASGAALFATLSDFDFWTKVRQRIGG